LLKVLKIYFKDNVKAHILLPDGTYQRCRRDGKALPCRSQRVLFEEAQAAVRMREQKKPTKLEPYRRHPTPRSRPTH